MVQQCYDAMHNVGIEPTTLGLWDLRAANCANRASVLLHHSWCTDAVTRWKKIFIIALSGNRTRATPLATAYSNHWTNSACLLRKIIPCIRAPRIELGTYCVWSSRHNQLDQARWDVDRVSAGLVFFCGRINYVHRKTTTFTPNILYDTKNFLNTRSFVRMLCGRYESPVT